MFVSTVYDGRRRNRRNLHTFFNPLSCSIAQQHASARPRRRPLWNSLLPWRRDGARSLAPPALLSRSPPHQRRSASEGLHLRSRTSGFLLAFLFLAFFSPFVFSSPPSLAVKRTRSVASRSGARITSFLQNSCRRSSLPVNQLPLASLSFMCASQHPPPSLLLSRYSQRRLA